MKVDTLKMLSKMTNAAEALMPTETREGAIKKAVEAHKRLDMVLEELKFMDSEAGTNNQIIQGFVEIVAETTEDELLKIKAAEADALKMLSAMAEAAEAPMTTEKRKGVLKMVAEAPKKLEMASG